VADRSLKSKYPKWPWTIHECDDGYVHTAPVGSFQPNGFGLYDMIGNVWEWVQDCWNDSYKGAPGDGSAWESGDCGRRVVRGGSWGNNPENCRSAIRFRLEPGDRNDDLGFRLARTL
jgi:formylglycine-generating enzyme required for sulfatase activity